MLQHYKQTRIDFDDHLRWIEFGYYAHEIRSENLQPDDILNDYINHPDFGHCYLCDDPADNQFHGPYAKDQISVKNFPAVEPVVLHGYIDKFCYQYRAD